MSAITNRYEFIYFFDVTNGNPNGDPDAGNLPRIDPETSHGLVTDVCLKRKIRNYVTLNKGENQGFHIYITEKAILNNKHKQAYESNGLDEKQKTSNNVEIARDWMCKNFYDVRTFGAVMSTGINCGQVRGPVQFAFASSIDPIFPVEVSITRMAVTEGKESDDDDKKRTMGRKHIVPYGLYRAHGYVSAKLAERTGFTGDDLNLLWESLQNMFEHDRSAARGEMSARKLFVFKHNSDVGNAPAHQLFDLVKVERMNNDKPARNFSDYRITAGECPAGVELCELI